MGRNFFADPIMQERRWLANGLALRSAKGSPTSRCAAPSSHAFRKAPRHHNTVTRWAARRTLLSQRYWRAYRLSVWLPMWQVALAKLGLAAAFACHLVPVERRDDSDALEAVWPLVCEVNLSVGVGRHDEGGRRERDKVAGQLAADM